MFSERRFVTVLKSKKKQKNKKVSFYLVFTIVSPVSEIIPFGHVVSVKQVFCKKKEKRKRSLEIM